MAAFTLSDVCRNFDGIEILDHLSLEIPERQFTAVIGPSGSGKTSLLRLLNRLDEPTGGTIHYLGQPVAGFPVRQLRARVGFVFQTPVMFSGTVRDNLTVASGIAGIQEGNGDQRMRESLRLAEVSPDLLDRDAARLSVGQKQRVCIARTLMTGPETLLLDEPTASLDPETADKLVRTIAQLSGLNGVTIVSATHRLAEAKRMSSYVVMLDGGSLVEAGPTAEIFERSEHPRIRSFLESVT